MGKFADIDYEDSRANLRRALSCFIEAGIKAGADFHADIDELVEEALYEFVSEDLVEEVEEGAAVVVRETQR